MKNLNLKTIIILLLISFITIESYSQRDTVINRSKPTLFQITEHLAEFPGGDHALEQFIQENLIYPKNVTCNDGEVIVHFTVNKRGKVKNT